MNQVSRCPTAWQMLQPENFEQNYSVRRSITVKMGPPDCCFTIQRVKEQKLTLTLRAQYLLYLQSYFQQIKESVGGDFLDIEKGAGKKRSLAK